MKQATLSLALAAGAALFFASSAFAQADPYDERRVALDVHHSLFGPYGLVGISAGYAPHPTIFFSVGAGLSAFGPRGGATVRARPLRRGPHALGIELSAAVGRHEDLCFYEEWEEECVTWRAAVFLRPGVSYELLTPGGFHFATYGGAAVLVNGRSGRAENPVAVGLRVWGYGGLSLGYAFRTH